MSVSLQANSTLVQRPSDLSCCCIYLIRAKVVLEHPLPRVISTRESHPVCNRHSVETYFLLNNGIMVNIVFSRWFNFVSSPVAVFFVENDGLRATGEMFNRHDGL